MAQLPERSSSAASERGPVVSKTAFSLGEVREEAQRWGSDKHYSLFMGRRSGEVASKGTGMGSGGIMVGMDVGEAVPVVRRHSYTMGGRPR